MANNYKGSFKGSYPPERYDQQYMRKLITELQVAIDRLYSVLSDDLQALEDRIYDLENP